jgi:hypothetical protein
MGHLNNEDKKAIDYYKKFIKEQSLNDNPSSFISVNDQNRFNVIIHELNAHLFSGGSFDSFFEQKVGRTNGDINQTNLINTIKQYVNEELSKINKLSSADSFKFEDFQDWEIELLKGDSLTFNDLTEEQKDELKGPPGTPLTFNDLNEVEIKKLTGKKGSKGDSAQLKYRGTHNKPPTLPKPGDIYRDTSKTPSAVYLYDGKSKKWMLLVQDGDYMGGTPGGGGLGENDVNKLINAVIPPKDFNDATFNIFDNDDNTKKIIFQASNIASGNSREITMSDYDIDLSTPFFNSVSATSADFDSVTATSAVIGNETPGRVLKIGSNGELQLDTTIFPPYIKGQLSYDPSSLTIVADTGINDVRLQLGEEEYYLVYNNSGNVIANGKACFASGKDTVRKVLTIGLADATFFFTSAQILGLATHDIGIDELGLVTKRGIVRDFDTTGFNSSLVWLGTSGDMTTEIPKYPTQRINMGVNLDSHATSGSFFIESSRLTRAPINGAYSFTSTGVNAGTFWKGGFYEWETTNITLAIGGSTTIGQANIAKAAHVGLVASGPGSVVGGGQVGMKVTGVLDSETGTQTAGVSAIITDDITSLTLDMYAETLEKFSDVITYELYVVSGSPSSASLTFNRGFSKYDDFEDRDYTITGLEITWQGNANSSLDIGLLKHTTTGWNYAAAGFTPGNGDICRKSVDQALAGDVANNIDGSYKRTALNSFINGRSGTEGHIIQIITGANSTIQTMDVRVDAVSEVLDF